MYKYRHISWGNNKKYKNFAKSKNLHITVMLIVELTTNETLI